MTMLRTLKGAREILSTPETWTTETGARDKDGAKVGFDMPSACKWCLWGALCMATGRMLNDVIDDDMQLFEILGFQYGTDIFAWNDAQDRTHAEVLARLDDAIARASK